MHKNKFFIYGIFLLLSPHIKSDPANSSASTSSELEKTSDTIDRLNQVLKVLDISTQVEGDLDPDDKIKLTTRIVDHVNGETFYLVPVLEKIDGKFSYSQRLVQSNGDDKYLLSGQANAQVESDNNLAIHVQQFKSGEQRVNQELYARYAEYLKKYIDFVYSNEIDLDPTKLQDLQNQHVYYGSISNGLGPAVEAGFRTENLKKQGTVDRSYSTMGGTNGIQESSVSYGVSNLPGNGEAHSIQNVVASATGNATVSGLKINSKETPEQVESRAVGQGMAQPGPGVSMTIVDAAGKVNADGFTENASYSEDENGTLATVGEVFNQSVHDFPVDVAKEGQLNILKPFEQVRMQSKSRKLGFYFGY